MRRTSYWVAAAASAVLALTACSGGGSSGSQAAGAEAAADPDATFTFVYTVDNATFDPDKIAHVAFSTQLWPIYDTLTHRTSELGVEPMLAASWEFPDPNTLELSLIEDWQYHDGTPFDAESVKANLERSMTLPGSVNAGQLEFIESVEVVDDQTVRIRTAGPATPLLALLSGPAGMMMSPAVFDDPGQDVNPTGGSGAYEIAEYVPGDRVEYEAVDDYWDPDAIKVNHLVITYGGDEVKLNTVLTDPASATFLYPDQLAAVEDNPDVVVDALESTQVRQVILNTSRSEFADARVRQALNLAIDRDGVDELMSGYCEPTGQLFPPAHWASNKDLESPEFDLERAKSLLAEAGLPNGFSFELQVFNGPDYQAAAQLLQSNWAEIGVDVQVVPYDTPALTENFAVQKTADAVLTTLWAAADPSGDTQSFYTPEGFWNPGGLTDERLIELHQAGLQAVDQDARAEVYGELMEVAAEVAGPNLPLCAETDIQVAGSRVQGLEHYRDKARVLRGVSIAAQ
ncbi:ABC transporter substrate-binding protein [Geodermatophilus sp. URMC 63]